MQQASKRCTIETRIDDVKEEILYQIEYPTLDVTLLLWREPTQQELPFYYDDVSHTTGTPRFYYEESHTTGAQRFYYSARPQ